MILDFYIFYTWLSIQIISKIFSKLYIFFISQSYLNKHFVYKYRFHTFNASRTSEGLSVANVTATAGPGSTQESEVFARSQDHRTPRGWLVHLINL